MAKIILPRYFIEEQGYNISQKNLIQENKSSILLENNGKLSISKSTNHIKTRYLFVTDRLAQGDLER